ncbi:MAG: T9SS type A sorting domain-containing protein [Bacteroidetes bacterium]|nr:T9SS type A sorting domain-containing protein [Bacteroidota bacterium]
MALALVLMLFGQASFAQAVFFELSAEPGNQASSTGTSSGPNFSAPVLTRGAGVTATAGAGSMNSSAWFASTTPTTLAEAIANNDYYEFTVNTINCLFFNPTTITIVLRSSATGPNTATLRCSSDGFTADIGTVTVTTTSVLLSFSETISPNSQSVTYRLYGYGGGAGGGNPGSGGTMRIGTSVVATDNDIEVFASTTQVMVAQVADFTVIDGASVPATVLTPNVPGATVNWSRTLPFFGLTPTSGTGDIPTFTAFSGGGTNTGTFTVNATANGCTGPDMVFTITVIPAPCSITAQFSGTTGPCNDNGTPNDPSDDFFLKNVSASFFNRPVTGLLQIVPGGDQIGTYEIPVQDIIGNSHVFTNVKFKADGTNTVAQVNFTAEPTCIANIAGVVNVPSCSAGPPCEVIGYSFTNISACNDNGTPNNSTDDYFTVNVEVLYSNSTNGDSLILEGPDVVFRRTTLAQVGTNVSTTLSAVRFRADGQAVDFTGKIGTFNNIHCSLPGTGPSVNPCSSGGGACDITSVTLTNIGPCDDNGTNDPTDDFFPADVVINYVNRPPTGLLQIEPGGDAITIHNIAVGSLPASGSHTFTNVHFKADGTQTVVEVEFTIPANACVQTITGPTVQPCSPICDITSVTLQNIGPCDDNGTPNDISDDFFPADVAISFVNRPESGLLQIEPGGDAITIHNVAVAGLPVNGSHTFTNVHFKADNTVTVVEVEFTVPANLCVQTITGPTVPPCPCPQVTFGPGGANQTVECNGSGNTTQFNAWLAAGGFANVNPSSGPIVSITHGTPVETLLCGNTKTYTVLFTFTNDCGNSANIGGQFRIEDNTPPAITSGMIASCYPTAAAAEAAALSVTTAVDGCGGTVTLNAIASGTCSALVTVAASDLCGNSTTFTYSTRIDNTPPTITCAAQTTPLNCPATPVFTPPTATDNCPGTAAITFTDATVPGACPGTFTTTRTWTATDQCGNTATCARSITVQDVTPPPVPANGASTVACPALAIAPVPPVVIDACAGAITPTGPVIVNVPNPLTCEGTRTFTFTYTDCSGNSAQWSHVTTVERLPFTITTPTGMATVDCPDKTDVQPTPPVVLSNCGEVLVPVLFNVTAKPGCEGNRNYTFRYTDCEGNFADWIFIYTVEYLDFAVPPSETLTVECPLNASEPVPPTVFDNCGKLLNPIGPVTTSTANAFGCEGSRKYAWTYSDCEGNAHVWSKTFNFEYSADFFTYPDVEDVVSCLLYAQPPFPPTIYDICGQEISVSGPTVSESISPTGCSGWRKYAFVYTDCGGHSHPWSLTYTINDDQAPLGTCPSGPASVGGGIALNVTDIACIEDVPCPGDYDFTIKVEELLVAGNIFDVCSGTDLIVTLDSWTDLWQCSDADGDGVYTFGRTFYFRIADLCGNEFPDVCAVTYSGECLPIETFRQEAWGIVGGAPGSFMNTSDIIIIEDMLAYGPVVVGGGNRSLTLTEPPCIVALLPGIGGPTVLANCHQTNCTGCNPSGPSGMKNALAANAVALTLNLRFDVEYLGLPMNDVRNQSLGCIDVHPCIYYCDEGGDCKLRVFDADGNQYLYPYTIGGLLDLANHYLGGNLNLTPGQSVLYATALNESLGNVNAYWNEGQTPTSCAPGADASPIEGGEGKALPTGNKKSSVGFEFSLAPNPAGREVTFKLAELTESQAVTFEVYNSLGQQVLRKEFGSVQYVNERIDLSSLGNGLYIVSVKAGGMHFEQKLVISKD